MFLKKGQLLLVFDMDFIKSRGYKVVTPVVVTNADEFKSILATNYGQVTRNNEIIKIEA